MKNPLQPRRNWLSRMRLPSASAALALAAVLASAVITTPVAQAQTLKVLHSFNGVDGTGPSQAPLVQATNGDLYGTTGGLGGHEGRGHGTAFKITPSGTLTTLHIFFTPADGVGPVGLVQDTNGNLYGTTGGGGANGDGTVFSLSVGLGPFVETRLTSGKVGAAVTILGTKLTGATSVKFNGKTAVFKVVSSSEITTAVPEGATTGKVEVKTPSGTLISNVDYRVTK